MVVVAIALVMTTTILWVEDVEGLPALFDVLILGVALAVAAVPEGLRRRLALRPSLHLTRPGTLTKNEMTVRVLITAGSSRIRAVSTTGVRDNGVGGVGLALLCLRGQLGALATRIEQTIRPRDGCAGVTQHVGDTRHRRFPWHLFAAD